MIESVVELKYVETGGPEVSDDARFAIPAGEQSLPCSRWHRVSKPGQRLPLLDLPLEQGERNRTERKNQTRAQHVTALHRRRGSQHFVEVHTPARRKLIQCGIKVASVDTTEAVKATAFVLGQPSRRARQPAGRRQRLGKLQVLEAVQRVVVHEVTDRGLAWQHMVEVMHAVGQALADIPRRGQLRFHIRLRRTAQAA